MRKKNMTLEHIGPLMENLLGEIHKNVDQGLLKIDAIWHGSMEEGILENTKPSALRGRILYVNVSSSVWLHELHFEKNRLIEQINQALGRRLVEDIRFKVGQV